MNKKLIWLLYGIVTSLALVVAGALLMVACYEIYTSGGPQIYTAEKIAEAFAKIAVPVYIAVFLSLGGLVLHLFIPLEEKRKTEKNYKLMLRRLYQKTDLFACQDEKLVKAIRKQSRLRNIHSWISAILLVIGCVVFLVYACNGANFHSTEITQSMIRSVLVLLPCMLLPFGYSVFTAYFNWQSLRKELELLKQVDAPCERIKFGIKEDPRGLQVYRLVLLIAAVVLVIVGIVGVGYTDVLTKAVNICRECVGLG